LLSGLTGVRGGVHSASTVRSIASASRSETAWARLSRVRWPEWRSIIAMLEPMNRETANTEMPARSAKMA